MKIGYTVKYKGENKDLNDKKGKIVEKPPFLNFISSVEWCEVDFGEGIGKHSCFKTNLEIVSRQFQLKFNFTKD
ncbi:MAG: hypothetical protein ABSH16_00285 [Sedimentisphaerales bacterium]